MAPLVEDLDRWMEEACRRAEGLRPEVHLRERGTVERIGDGVATLSGLPGVRQDELVHLGESDLAMAVSLEESRFGCILLSPGREVAAGTPARGTGEVVRVPVGDGLLGRVVDPLGRPLDGGSAIASERRDPIDRPPPGIIERDLVSRPLETGITVVDSMIPLGRGQRELIIGDRQTGRTAIAVDAIINQRGSGVVCVYAAIGQKASSVNRVIDAVKAHGAPERCIFVVGEAEAPPGLQWITPYAACTMAEFFMERGEDALLVLDDLTQHAAIHRQVSLLLRRPPGREAYPGDIFYVHARLLERSAKLSSARGGGSLTALPIAETQEGNLSAYIPTNLISITDGQIYLEPKLFHEGQKPAVDVGKSVSRVGGKAQSPLIRDLAKTLRLDYAQFTELEVFTRFGTMADARTMKTVEHGRRIRAFLAQPQYRPRSPSHQAALLLALSTGLLDGMDMDSVDRFKEQVAGWLGEHASDLARRLDASGVMDGSDREALLACLGRLASTLAPD